MRATLSVFLIVKNEAVHINRVLSCFKTLADEIVVVDTGSTDNTVDLVSKYTLNIYYYQWNDDFAAARNFALSHCTKDFILWLDADDYIEEKSIKYWRQIFLNPIDWDIAFVSYHLINTVVLRERLFRNRLGLHFKYPVHECLDISETHKCKYLPQFIIHHDNLGRSEDRSRRNIRIMKRMTQFSEYNQSHHLWQMYARDYVSGGDANKAIKTFQKALSLIDPHTDHFTVSLMHYELAMQQIKLKKTSEAMANLTFSILHFPRWKEPYFELAKLYYAEERYEDCLQMLEHCNRVNKPTTPDIMNWELYNTPILFDWLSVLYGRVGQTGQALKYVDKVLKVYPNDKRLVTNRQFWKQQMIRSQ